MPLLPRAGAGQPAVLVRVRVRVRVGVRLQFSAVGGLGVSGKLVFVLGWC